MGDRAVIRAWAAASVVIAGASCGGEVEAHDEREPAGSVHVAERSGAAAVPELSFPSPVQRTALAPELAPDPSGAIESASDPAPHETVGDVSVHDAGGKSAGILAGALDRTIERIVANAVERARKLSGGKVHGRNTTIAVCLIDAETGAELAARSATQAVVPASNLKLFTVAAAAKTLGLDAQWETPFEAHGRLATDGTLHGELVVRAAGDPLYRREGDGSIDRWLDPLVRDLRAAGIRRITGGLVLDEGDWLEPGPGPDWPSSDQFWTDYCAFAAGLTANGSCFRAMVEIPAGATRARITLRPRWHGLAERLGVRDGKNAVRIGATATTVTVAGTYPAAKGTETWEFSYPDPVMLFGHAFTGGLRARGIEVGADPTRRRHVERANGTDRRVVHVMRNPVASAFPAILLDSNNPVADQVFLTLGARRGGAGTRAASAAVVRDAVRSLGVSTAGLEIVGGSGLSKANRVTARQLATLVSRVAREPATRAAFDALPLAGSSGSLTHRMRDTAAEGVVRAKTGWVSGASGLSGLARSADGRDVAFSILVAYPRVSGLNTSVWKPMQDEICVAVAGWAREEAIVR